jgi:hypothetical protein
VDRGGYRSPQNATRGAAAAQAAEAGRERHGSRKDECIASICCPNFVHLQVRADADKDDRIVD